MTDNSDSTTTDAPHIPSRKEDGLNVYQKWHLMITGAALAVAVCTLAFIAFQVRNVATQTEKQTEAIGLQNSLLKVQAYQAFSNSWAQIDMAFMNHPELRPFFYGGKTVDNPAIKESAIALAEMQLDIFETFFMDELTGHLPWGKRGTKDRANWENFMRYTFENSSVLCKHLEGVSDWYSDEFRSFAAPACKKRGIIIK